METVVVSISDAARAIGLSRSKVYELLQSGDLSFVKIGRRSLVTVDSVRALVKRNIVGGAD